MYERYPPYGMWSVFIDATLDGFLGILNYKYEYRMEVANIYFVVSAREKELNQRHISLVIMSSSQGGTIFDFDKYFVLNHIPPLHWGIIHVLPTNKCIVCFDGYHGKEHDKYELVKKCLNMLANYPNLSEYKDCEWQRKYIYIYIYIFFLDILMDETVLHV